MALWITVLLAKMLALPRGCQRERWWLRESRAAARLAAPVAPKRDIAQFRQACKEAGLTRQERYAASKELHAEK